MDQRAPNRKQIGPKKMTAHETIIQNGHGLPRVVAKESHIPNHCVYGAFVRVCVCARVRQRENKSKREGREGGRRNEGGKEEGKEGGKEGGREGGRTGGREVGREVGREGGRKISRPLLFALP
jgi:hypothetical protein